MIQKRGEERIGMEKAMNRGNDGNRCGPAGYIRLTPADESELWLDLLTLAFDAVPASRSESIDTR